MVFFMPLPLHRTMNMGDNIKSGSFLQKPLEIFAYVIYIERRNPFRIYCLIYLSTWWGWGGIWAPSGRTSFKPRPICLKFPTMIYFTHARMEVTADLQISSPFIGKRDMPGTANEEEKMYLECEYHPRTFAPECRR